MVEKSLAVRAPTRFNEAWKWIAALDAYYLDNRTPLEELLRGADPIPDAARSALADIVSGALKPSKKAVEKARIPPAERMMLAAALLLCRDICEISCSQENLDFTLSRKSQQEARRSSGEAWRETLEEAAAGYGVSVGTLEDLVGDLRKKLKDWEVG